MVVHVAEFCFVGVIGRKQAIGSFRQQQGVLFVRSLHKNEEVAPNGFWFEFLLRTASVVARLR